VLGELDGHALRQAGRRVPVLAGRGRAAILRLPMPSLSDLKERAELVQQRLAQLKEGL
jgi:hypothetical protein